MPPLDHYRRLLEAYLLRAPSHLDFWHENPADNPHASFDRLGEYYLSYEQKADYRGPFDPEGVPLLNYRGRLGLQYNPIAVAQYGLACFNRYRQADTASYRDRFSRIAEWLIRNLERNAHGVDVWQHHFPWPYRELLRPPWASALAQGQGISVLVRAHALTKDPRYWGAARKALRAFELPMSQGGVIFQDAEGNFWPEEYLVDPPSHILNGAVCASWGLFDYWLASGDQATRRLFDQTVKTLADNLSHYDTGFWSLYELPSHGVSMLASPFYHRLHIVQMRVLEKMTGQALFTEAGRRWEAYERNPACRRRAIWGKLFFKLRYY